ncbi:phosphoribosylformylglycinamidine synthase [Sediminispirochaeta bajacaliforniensis]|uniref:phosphoribosylformylglycinamidine synthase n=1 Tax=Sediminispirochaeta bajacaliforniensis TaxID=148 RepID=UPI0003A5C73F|nr:phosphoribosylformylglycinamidine synthase [Sediminispirochaeta bajacaliforniensis]
MLTLFFVSGTTRTWNAIIRYNRYEIKGLLGPGMIGAFSGLPPRVGDPPCCGIMPVRGFFVFIPLEGAMFIFFEKRESFRTSSDELLQDFHQRLGIDGLSRIRLFSGYRISGDLSVEVVARALRDPVTDLGPLTDPPFDDAACWSFAWGLLPAQFDQRGASAKEAVELQGGAVEAVRSISCCLFYGELSEKDRQSIRKNLVNPVDSYEIDLDGEEGLLRGFRLLSDAALEELGKRHGIVMAPSELRFCRNYFRDKLDRDPTLTELAILATYWSDHCRHTTFNTPLTHVSVAKSHYLSGLEETLHSYHDRFGDELSLMNMATAGVKILSAEGKIPDLDISEEINAASIRIAVSHEGGEEKAATGEPWLLMFKNETHNHPTEIEPFGGAATCIGGAIRDPLSGRSYVHQAMRLSGAAFPDPNVEELEDELLRSSKLSRTTLARESAHGYSSYGNQIGIPTGLVRELYAEGFRAKRFEAGAVVGAVPLSSIRRERPVAGDVVILVGGATGRDGIGGATGSSRAHDAESIHRSAAEVQKGNPPEERALQRFFRKRETAALIKRCNDFGAGGVAVAVGELAPGLSINLSAVPLKYRDLSPLEITLSESQERMAVVVAAGDADTFIALAAEEDLIASIIAEVTEEPLLTIASRDGIVAQLPRQLLDAAGGDSRAEARVPAPSETSFFDEILRRRNAVQEDRRWALLLSEDNVAGSEGLTEQFDSSVGARSVLSPLGGKYQLTPAEAMAALIPSKREDVSTASIMSCGYAPEIGLWSPYHGAIYAILEAVCRGLATGAALGSIRLSLQEYFPPPGEDAQGWGAPASALLGALRAQLALEIPAIGGKDSMSGSWMALKVPPTLAAFAVAPVSAASVQSPEFKKIDSKVFLIHHSRLENGEPNFSLFLRQAAFLEQLMQDGNVLACRSVGFGGVAQAVAEMGFGNGIGFDGDLPKGLDSFDPAYGSFLIEWNGGAVLPEDGESFLIAIGSTTEKQNFRIGGMNISMDRALAAWRSRKAELYPGPGGSRGSSAGLPAVPSSGAYPAPRLLTRRGPEVLVLSFPGTNCEEETAAAFRREGGEVSHFLFRTRCAGGPPSSLESMEKAIAKAKIVVIPGGFSAGDEPDGAAKYIAAVLGNPRIAGALEELLYHRDGLMLGICNGFQALVRSGLLPYGRVTARRERDPVLAPNQIGRHVSRYCGTRCESDLGPWMRLMSPGDLQVVPVSHGEGRFVASDALLDELEQNRQVAFRYCDNEGHVALDYPDNPNASMRGIEGILSPDGRVLGKMGHCERSGRYVAKNIPGAGWQPIFRAGIDYFL